MRLSELVLLAAVGGLACATEDPVSPPRTTATVTLTLSDSVIEVGQPADAVAVVRDASGSPISGAAVSYAAEAPGTLNVDPISGAIRGIAPGTDAIVASIYDVSDRRVVRVFASPIRINEIYPNGERPGGWVELYNSTSVDIDMAGWTISGADSTRRFTIPSGAVIPAAGYLAVNEVTLPAPLGPIDTVHLFSRWGVRVDSYSWTQNPAASFSRCPDGSGSFTATDELTRKAPNACPGPGG